MNLLQKLQDDIRYQEGLNACINCGTCTAICPAAAFNNYDPRNIVDAVQHANEDDIRDLLESDTIWYCGECLSCKTRCPRSNTPGYIIQALRSLSVDTGLFTKSKQGQKQLAIKRTVGEHILRYGYCVYIDEISTDFYPEQGPTWNWFYNNREQVLLRLGTSYQKQGKGTLRKISKESLNELGAIFEVTGANDRFDKIEKHSAQAAKELGFECTGGKDAYFNFLYNDTHDD